MQPASFSSVVGYFFLLDFISAFFRFSATLNLTILLINSSGNGSSIGNLTEPFALV